MKINSKTAYLMFLIGVALIFPVRQSHAYLDPGSGSYVIQLVIAGLAGVLVSIKMFWGHIKAFFMGMFSKHKSYEPAKNEEDNN